MRPAGVLRRPGPPPRAHTPGRGQGCAGRDPAQLDAVEAGGLFRLLAADARAAQLGVVRRFTQPWEADASLRLRRGDPAVVDDYDAHGRLLGGDRRQLEDHAVHCWQAARGAGQSVVVTAADRATVDRLARRVQTARIEAGVVQPAGVATTAGQTIGVGARSLPPTTTAAWSATGGCGSATVTAGR